MLPNRDFLSVGVGLLFAFIVVNFADVIHSRHWSTQVTGEPHDLISSTDDPNERLPSLQFSETVLSDLEVLFVLDPNFHLCWEKIPVNHLTRAGLLPWVKSLKDFLSVGELLQVHA